MCGGCCHKILLRDKAKKMALNISLSIPLPFYYGDAWIPLNISKNHQKCEANKLYNTDLGWHWVTQDRKCQTFSSRCTHRTLRKICVKVLDVQKVDLNYSCLLRLYNSCKWPTHYAAPYHCSCNVNTSNGHFGSSNCRKGLGKGWHSSVSPWSSWPEKLQDFLCKQRARTQWPGIELALKGARFNQNHVIPLIH